MGEVLVMRDTQGAVPSDRSRCVAAGPMPDVYGSYGSMPNGYAQAAPMGMRTGMRRQRLVGSGGSVGHRCGRAYFALEILRSALWARQGATA